MRRLKETSRPRPLRGDFVCQGSRWVVTHPLLPKPTWWLQPLCSASFTAGVKAAASAKWDGLHVQGAVGVRVHQPCCAGAPPIAVICCTHHRTRPATAPAAAAVQTTLGSEARAMHAQRRLMKLGPLSWRCAGKTSLDQHGSGGTHRQWWPCLRRHTPSQGTPAAAHQSRTGEQQGMVLYAATQSMECLQCSKL